MCKLEKRRPNGRFFLGPAGSWLAPPNFVPFQSEAWPPQGLRPHLHQNQSLPFSHQGYWNLEGQKWFLRGVLDHWRTGGFLEWSLGFQDVRIDAMNNFSCSFSVPFRKCHLADQDSTCPPSLELDPWRTGMVPDRSLHFKVSNNSTL